MALTFEEQEAAADELFGKVADIVKQYIAEDMEAGKVVSRMAIVGQLGGTTRTTAMGAALFAGVYGCLTGLTKSQLLGLVGDLFDAVEANPATADAKQAYAEHNAACKMAAAVKSQEVSDKDQTFETPKGMILSPMPKLKQ